MKSTIFILACLATPAAAASEWGARVGVKTVSDLLPAPGGELFVRPSENVELSAGLYSLIAWISLDAGMNVYFDTDHNWDPYIGLHSGADATVISGEQYGSLFLGIRHHHMQFEIGPSWKFNRSSDAADAPGVFARISYTAVERRRD